MKRNHVGHTCALIALTATIAASPALLGCSSSSDSTSAGTMDAGATTEEYVADVDAEKTDGADEASDPSSAVVIRDASVSLRTRGYDEALKAVRTIITESGGTVTNSSESGGHGRYITMESRVDPDKLDAAVERLRGIEGCTVLFANVSSNDVTRTYNDTERRIEILNQQYEHYEKMLEQAQTTDDMLLISDRMYDVLAEIRAYTDERDDMRHDADRSKLTVSIEEELVEGSAPSSNIYVDAWDDSWGFFGQAIRALILLIIFLIPFALLALAIVAVVLGIRRARRRRKGEKAPETDPAPEATDVTPEADDGQADGKTDGHADGQDGRPRHPLS